MSRRAWYLTIALAFAVHNAEEAIAAPRLLTLMQRAPEALRSFYAGISAFELRVSLVILTLASFVLTALALRYHRSTRAGYAMLVFASVIGLNALAHVALSVIFRTYMPGLITALSATLPVAALAVVRARRDGWIQTNVYWTLLPMALVIHGPALVLFIRASIAGIRALSGSPA